VARYDTPRRTRRRNRRRRPRATRAVAATTEMAVVATGDNTREESGWSYACKRANEWMNVVRATDLRDCVIYCFFLFFFNSNFRHTFVKLGNYLLSVAADLRRARYSLRASTRSFTRLGGYLIPPSRAILSLWIVLSLWNIYFRIASNIIWNLFQEFFKKNKLTKTWNFWKHWKSNWISETSHEINRKYIVQRHINNIIFILYLYLYF